jgi:hypothetical protein
MKQCPTCQSIYSEDDDFCPNEGSVLLIVTGGDRSASFQYVSANIPTEVMSPIRSPVFASNGNPGNWTYLIAGALGTLIIVGAIFVIWRGNTGSSVDNFTSAGKPAADPAAFAAFPIGNAASQAGTPDNVASSNSVSVTVPIAKLSPHGRWVGDWSSPSGAYLTIVMDLNDDGTGSVAGKIEWTLRRTTRPEKINKIGLSATEFVNGHFDPVSRTLNLNGYRKNDPNNVLVMLDSYRLALSGDTHRLNGTARNGGKWNASVNVSR